MEKFETLLASVQYPSFSANVVDIENKVETINGVSEVSINPVSKKALIVIDRGKTSFERAKTEMKKEGMVVSEILLRH